MPRYYRTKDPGEAPKILAKIEEAGLRPELEQIAKLQKTDLASVLGRWSHAGDKRCAMYLYLREARKLSWPQIGLLFGRDRDMARQACNRIPKERVREVRKVVEHAKAMLVQRGVRT